MNVSLNKTTDVSGKFVVSVEEADYAPKVKEELKKVASRASIPGFRAGHIPADQIRRRFGKEVKSDVLNNLVYDAVINYIRENKLNILGEPLPVEVREVNLDDKDYTFEYEAGFAPAIDVTIDKNVKLPIYNIIVSDEMADEQDKSLRQRFGSQVPGEEADERALIKGALQQLNEDGSVNENEGAIAVEKAIVAPFHFTDKEEAARFLGKKLNDKVVFNPYKSCNGNAAELSSMLNLDREIAADVKSDFEMAISEIIVLKPAEHNQEFFDNVFGKDKVTTDEEYNAKLREEIANSLKSNSIAMFDNSVRTYLIDKYGKNMELPVEFLKKWLIARNTELNADNIDAEFDDMLPSLQWQLIRENIAEKFEIKITEDDIMAYARQIAFQQFAQYGMTNMDQETLNDFAKRLLNDKNHRAQITEQVSDSKLFDVIRNNITVEQKEVSLDEFKEIAAKSAQ